MLDNFALNSGNVGDKATMERKCGVARKSTEISTIPRTWWEEDEKWAEIHEIDNRGLIIKMVTQRFMMEALGYPREDAVKFLEKIVVIFPTTPTLRQSPQSTDSSYILTRAIPLHNIA